MIKTDPTMLVCTATPGPWQAVDEAKVSVFSLYRSFHSAGATNGGGRLIIESHDFGPIAAMSMSSELAVTESDARLICAAPPLLKVAQKLLLWMEECMAACDFNQDDMDLYHELRQTIRTAGGFSSETHWWQGPCICDACGHAWQGVVEIPIESTYPQVPLECSECHQMTGGPA